MKVKDILLKHRERLWCTSLSDFEVIVCEDYLRVGTKMTRSIHSISHAKLLYVLWHSALIAKKEL